jgi:hypothetical protein
LQYLYSIIIYSSRFLATLVNAPPNHYRSAPPIKPSKTSLLFLSNPQKFIEPFLRTIFDQLQGWSVGRRGLGFWGLVKLDVFVIDNFQLGKVVEIFVVFLDVGFEVFVHQVFGVRIVFEIF